MAIRRQPSLLHIGGERDPETALHIADEAFDFPFGLRPIGPAQTRQKASMACIVQKSRMETVPSRPIGVALQNHRLHIVEQHFALAAPPSAEKAFSWHRISVSMRSLSQNST